MVHNPMTKVVLLLVGLILPLQGKGQNAPDSLTFRFNFDYTWSPSSLPISTPTPSCYSNILMVANPPDAQTNPLIIADPVNADHFLVAGLPFPGNLIQPGFLSFYNSSNHGRTWVGQDNLANPGRYAYTPSVTFVQSPNLTSALIGAICGDEDNSLSDI